MNQNMNVFDSGIKISLRGSDAAGKAAVDMQKLY